MMIKRLKIFLIFNIAICFLGLLTSICFAKETKNYSPFTLDIQQDLGKEKNFLIASFFAYSLKENTNTQIAFFPVFTGKFLKNNFVNNDILTAVPLKDDKIVILKLYGTDLYSLANNSLVLYPKFSFSTFAYYGMKVKLTYKKNKIKIKKIVLSNEFQDEVQPDEIYYVSLPYFLLRGKDNFLKVLKIRQNYKVLDVKVQDAVKNTFSNQLPEINYKDLFEEVKK